MADRTALPAAEAIRWRLPRLADVVCLDIDTPELERERLNAASIRSLFDFVAERATERSDRVMAGGFVSRATGLPFSEAEVDEYRDRRETTTRCCGRRGWTPSPSCWRRAWSGFSRNSR